jgi:hypothetical protein
MVGLFLSVGLYFARSSDAKLYIDAGRLLDQDMVYLKDGSFIRCWIVDEGGVEILVETEKGSFTLSRSVCKRIEKDVFLRFMRHAI